MDWPYGHDPRFVSGYHSERKNSTTKGLQFSNNSVTRAAPSRLQSVLDAGVWENEAAEVLIALGYKKSEVDKALAVLLNEKLDTNGYVKRALSLLVK